MTSTASTTMALTIWFPLGLVAGEQDPCVHPLDDPSMPIRGEGEVEAPPSGRCPYHHRQNGVHLEPKPGVVGIGTPDVGGDYHAGDGGHHAAQQVGGDHHHGVLSPAFLAALMLIPTAR